MAGVIKRSDGSLIIKWRDATGRLQQRRTKCRTRAEARRLAEEIQHNVERQRLGLDPIPDSAPTLTVLDLWSWWWNLVGQRLRGKTVQSFGEKHIVASLGPLTLREVTPARIEALLAAKEDDLGPESLNHVRALIGRLFSTAIRHGKWVGANPALAVGRRKVSKKVARALTPEQAGAVLTHVPVEKRALFAAAIYSGMRKGELLGLRKSDVSLSDGTITIRRSWEADTTKGGHEDVIPIHEALRPYLAAAMQRSKSDLVFPGPDGCLARADTKLTTTLRRTLARAGIVEGYEHVCRRPACGYTERKDHPETKKCPRCGKIRLWAKPILVRVRFHDLRHTTATLLLKAGVPFAVVQRILRHRDPRTTVEVYGHLDLGDQRAALARLHIDAPPPDGDEPGGVGDPDAVPQPLVATASGDPQPSRPLMASAPSAQGAAVGAVGARARRKAADREEYPSSVSGLQMVGATGFEPATTCTPSTPKGISPCFRAVHHASAEVPETPVSAP